MERLQEEQFKEAVEENVTGVIYLLPFGTAFSTGQRVSLSNGKDIQCGPPPPLRISFSSTSMTCKP